MTIAYITQTFPSLTTTFIYREVLALERKGFHISTYAIWKPDENKLSPESRHLVNGTGYVFPVSRPDFLKAHLHFLATRPWKYLATAVYGLTRRGETWRNRQRTLFHFVEAVYLAKSMEEQEITHIHAHFTINAASIALILSRLLGVTFSFTAHNIFFTDRLLLREKVEQAQFIVAISEFSRQYLNDLVPDNHLDKIFIVHCGLSPESFAPPQSEPENDVPMIVFVAQLVERKGAPYLVEACKILAERDAHFHCVIIGGGAQETMLEQLIEHYDLDGQVELKGALFQEELKDYLDRADIFVLPCITTADGDIDGVPVSLMEAMAMQIPVISTDVSGIPELIQDNEEGLLVPEKNTEALADAIQKLLDDKAFREKLGQNARRKIIEEFDIDKNARQLASLFERYIR